VRLPPEHRSSPVWALVKQYADGRLLELRARLEADLSEKDSAATRAGIREMKKLLAIEYPELTTEQEPEQL
jgi:hypothetical protein